MIITSAPIWSQGGYSYGNNYDNDSYDNYRDGYRNSDNDRYASNYLDYYYSVMNRRDRKYLSDLEDKLIRRRRKALSNDYVSAKERREIRQVEQEIDRLTSRYPSQRRNNKYRSYNSGYKTVSVTPRSTRGPRCR